MKTVLITGAGGFLGRAAVQKFRAENWRVLATGPGSPDSAPAEAHEYRQLRLPDPDLHQWLREAAPDVCIHCAGSASVPQSMADPATDYAGNVDLTFTTLEAIRKNSPGCRFLLISSAAVYGEPDSLPVREQQSIAPLSPYGYHKRHAEWLCEEYSRIHGISTIVARVFSAYGPGLRRQVIWEICQQILQRGEIQLKGTGSETRDFIAASDVAEGLFFLARKAAARGEAYNLATGKQTSISNVARLLIQAWGNSARVTFDGQSRPGDPLNWEADISLIQSLGFTPKTSIEVGLRQTAQWIRQLNRKD